MPFSMLYSEEQILSFKSCLVFYAGDSLSVTEKSSTYDISFPLASISKNNSVSINQLRQQTKKKIRTKVVIYHIFNGTSTKILQKMLSVLNYCLR